MPGTDPDDECSDLNGPHSRLKEACDARGYDWRTITRNTDPDTYDRPERADAAEHVLALIPDGNSVEMVNHNRA